MCIYILIYVHFVQKMKCRANTIVCRFLQRIWFHTQMKDGINISSSWIPQRNCCSMKTCKSKFARRMKTQTFSTLLREFFKINYHLIVYNLPRLRIPTSINRIKENGFILKKKKPETEDFLLKLFRAQTMQTT